MESVYDAFLAKALEVAKGAGRIVKEAFYAKKVVEHKGITDLVTATDKQVEEFIISSLKSEFPQHHFLGEETFNGEAYNLSNDATWVIDPIDGTTNFVHGFPFVAVSIGLVINKSSVVGVVYNPILEELFHAVRGKGAFRNNERISVSTVKHIHECVVATNIGYDRTPEGIDFITGHIKHLMLENVRSLRAGGTSAVDMCSVACGRLDVYYEVGIHPWDIAAASLIVEEAGGQVLDTTGKSLDLENRRVLAGNADILRAVVPVLNRLPLLSKWKKFDKSN